MNSSKFTLRELQPADSPALTRLITEFDGELTTRFQVDPYQAIVSGTEYPTTGVVVEYAGHEGIVGMGTIRFGEVRFNGDTIPFAFLDGLKVHEEYRGQGLGHRIADWRIQRARETFGRDGVIATGMLYDNYASQAVASKWCREFAESAISVLVMPTRAAPPKAPAGITVHKLEEHEYEEFAHRQNVFFDHYNLNPPSTTDSIAKALRVSVEGNKPYRFYAAVDERGNLLAGAQTWARGLLKSDSVNHLPFPLRMMNSLLHILPPDYIIRDINVGGLWYQPDRLPAARFLWETIRWECKDQGNMVTAGFDRRDPGRHVPSLKPWHQPRPQITLAIHGPAPIDRERLFFSPGRV